MVFSVNKLYIHWSKQVMFKYIHYFVRLKCNWVMSCSITRNFVQLFLNVNKVTWCFAPRVCSHKSHDQWYQPTRYLSPIGLDQHTWAVHLPSCRPFCLHSGHFSTTFEFIFSPNWKVKSPAELVSLVNEAAVERYQSIDLSVVKVPTN